MYAIFASGGKQHCAEKGEILKLEKLDAEVGATVEFDKVLFIGGDNQMQTGSPYVAGARVLAEVVEHGRGDKINIIKFRRRKHYMKRQGHRQWYTAVKINDVVL